jgi:hypothetical protein
MIIADCNRVQVRHAREKLAMIGLGISDPVGILVFGKTGPDECGGFCGYPADYGGEPQQSRVNRDSASPLILLHQTHIKVNGRKTTLSHF